jgi:hypothetical protein
MSSDGAGGAPRAMLLAGAPLAAANAQRNSTRSASGVTDNWMAPSAGVGGE